MPGDFAQLPPKNFVRLPKQIRCRRKLLRQIVPHSDHLRALSGEEERDSFHGSSHDAREARQSNCSGGLRPPEKRDAHRALLQPLESSLLLRVTVDSRA